MAVAARLIARPEVHMLHAIDHMGQKANDVVVAAVAVGVGLVSGCMTGGHPGGCFPEGAALPAEVKPDVIAGLLNNGLIMKVADD